MPDERDPLHDNLKEGRDIGLLLIDFEGSGILQLTGTTKILWDVEKVTLTPGVERLVEFKLDQALKSAHAGTLRWRFMNYSPDNPWYC